MNKEIEEVCKKHGLDFQLIENGMIITKLKDIWEGVEFAKSKYSGCIFSLIANPELKLIKDKETLEYCFKDDFDPSTESAYVEQLKKEAFERFGEIKEGDRFELNGSIGEISDLGITSWIYRKETDVFGKHGVVLYKQGKWATKVKERVGVELVNFPMVDIETSIINFDFKLSQTSVKTNYSKFLKDLTNYVEKYLNGEV